MGEGSKPGSVGKPHPLCGWLEGTVTIAPGVDLTEPADPYWALDLEAFRDSLNGDEPPRGLHNALAALWWAKKDNWDLAHRLVMNNPGMECAWVHAFLHRTEGDIENACYWYARAQRSPATSDFDAEWDQIVRALLDVARDLE